MEIEVFDHLRGEISADAAGDEVEDFYVEGVHFDSEGVADGVDCCFTGVVGS